MFNVYHHSDKLGAYIIHDIIIFGEKAICRICSNVLQRQEGNLAEDIRLVASFRPSKHSAAVS